MEALLLTKSSDETWPRIRILLHHEIGKAVSEFSYALLEFEMDEQAKEDIFSKLKNHAIGIVERKAREEAAKVLYHVKERYNMLADMKFWLNLSMLLSLNLNPLNYTGFYSYSTMIMI